MTSLAPNKIPKWIHPLDREQEKEDNQGEYREEREERLEKEEQVCKIHLNTQNDIKDGILSDREGIQRYNNCVRGLQFVFFDPIEIQSLYRTLNRTYEQTMPRDRFGWAELIKEKESRFATKVRDLKEELEEIKGYLDVCHGEIEEYQKNNPFNEKLLEQRKKNKEKLTFALEREKMKDKLLMKAVDNNQALKKKINCLEDKMEKIKTVFRDDVIVDDDDTDDDSHGLIFDGEGINVFPLKDNIPENTGETKQNH